MNGAELGGAEVVGAEVVGVTPPPREPNAQKLSIAELGNRYGLLVAWAIVIVIFSFLRATFFTTANFEIIFGTEVVPLVLTLGLLFSLLAGEFDLSIAGVMSVSLVLVGWLNVVHHWSIGPAVAAGLLAGVGIGLVNSFFVIVVGVESIVVTLGSGTLLLGLAEGINNQTTGGISANLVNPVTTQLWGLPLAFYYGLGLTILVWYVFSYTPLGRYLFFVGAGRNVARLSGLRVDLIRAGSLVTTSFFAALAGVLEAGTLGSSDPNISASFLLPAFAAAFLGATAITPGRFNAWGSFAAVYFLATGFIGLELIGLQDWIQNVFYGGSLVLAVALSRLVGRRRMA